MKKFTSYTRGFTLIELLVVIAIIGILASVVLVSLSSARGKGKDAAVKEQLSGVRSQMELFANGGSYAGGCNAPASSNGALSIMGGVLGSANVATGATVHYNSAGAAAQVTCNDTPGSGSGWAAEAPLSDSTFWCVDSTGKSQSEPSTSLLSGTDVTCI